MKALMDTLASRVFRPLDRWRTGDQSFRYVSEVEAFNQLSPEAIQSHTLKRLREICAVANAQCPFYTERFAKAGIQDPAQITLEEFETLPYLTREDIRTHEDALVNRSIGKENMRVSATGGTTDSPVRFYMDWDAYYRRKSATIAFDRWFGYEPGKRLALLWGAERDFRNVVTTRNKLRNVLVDRFIFLPSSPLDDTIMKAHYETLREFQPALIQAYPTPLALFAAFLIRNNLKLSVPAISTSAEPLLPDHIEVITTAFGVTPFDWYGSRELGRIATSDQHHDGLYINAYQNYLEPVSTPTAGGSGLSKIIATDLWNVGFPLIRYDSGDMGIFDAESGRGGLHLPRLKSLVGRVADVFVNSKRQQIAGASLTGRILTESSEIEQIQIIQNDYQEFVIRYVPGDDYSKDTNENLKKALFEFLHEEANVKFEKVDKIPLTASGKRRICQVNFTPDI